MRTGDRAIGLSGGDHPEAMRKILPGWVDTGRWLDVQWSYSTTEATREETTMGAWVIGHNISGYLPEADTQAFETRDEAVSAFVDRAQEYAQTDDDHADDVLSDYYTSPDQVPDDEWPSMRAVVDSILTDDGPNAPDLTGKDYAMTVVDSNDRRIVFWLQWEPTRDPGTDDVGNELD